MGEPEALSSLQRVNDQLQQLKTVSETTESSKKLLMQSLQELDELLDKSARRSITRGAGAVDRATVDGEDVFVDMAIDALLREARGSLRIAADDLALLFLNPDDNAASCASIVRHLQQINNALQILPLPEIDALICGLCDVLKQSHRSGELGRDVIAATMINNESLQPPGTLTSGEPSFEANSIEQEIARLVVSIDFYLGCVLQPQPAASQLLVDANDALGRMKRKTKKMDTSLLCHRWKICSRQWSILDDRLRLTEILLRILRLLPCSWHWLTIEK
jgi:hypothetical protein